MRPVVEETLQGTVARVVHRNVISGWVIAKVNIEAAAFPVSVVGAVPGVEEGAILRFTGEWEQHPRFGKQFRAKFATAVKPETAEGMRRFLASSMVEGVGDVMAQRLVQAFGTDTLEIIDKHPERLTEVEGIGPGRARAVREAWDKHQGIREVMFFLHGHGVGAAHAGRIIAELGERAVPLITSNPYILAERIRGIGFLTADRIARSVGFDPVHPARLEAGLMHVLDEATGEGHCALPEIGLFERAGELLAVADAGAHVSVELLTREVDRLVLGSRVVREDGDVWVERLHDQEVRLGERLKALADAPPRDPVTAEDRDPQAALSDAERLLEVQLSDGQRRAVLATMGSRLVVVTGGPGTGKTTVVQTIVQVHRKAGRTVLLAAPTGRAAHRLGEATGRPSATLHRLLEFLPQDNKFQRNFERPLEGDVVIVDEASMIDLPLMWHLAEALPDGATLVLVGDADQLPSVGPGNVLADVIASRVVPVVRLDTVFRQAEGSLILTNAHRLLHGQVPERPAPGDANADFHFFERDDPKELVQTLVKLVTERIPGGFGLDPMRDVQVLSPMHRGVVGAQRLNEELQAALNPDGRVFRGGLREGDKVMQIRNDYDLGVFNGDVGVVTLANPETGKLHVALDGRTVEYEGRQSDSLVTAYAVSIHKSQGSEYPAVVVPVHTQHWIMLRRDLLYTAMTRGKRLVVLVGSRRALERCVRNDEVRIRRTRLADRLRGRVASHPGGR